LGTRLLSSADWFRSADKAGIGCVVAICQMNLQ